MRNFREYDFWRDSMDLSIEVYRLTQDFPKFDGLINQIQRAVVSIPSNIAEGSSRVSSTDFARYLEIALGSAYETETQLELSFRLGYISEQDFQRLHQKLLSIEKRILSFIITLRK